MVPTVSSTDATCVVECRCVQWPSRLAATRGGLCDTRPSQTCQTSHDDDDHCAPAAAAEAQVPSAPCVPSLRSSEK